VRTFILTAVLVLATVFVVIDVLYHIGLGSNTYGHYISQVANVLDYARFFAIPAALFAFMYQHQRGQPEKTLAWIALMLGFPFVGTIAYLFFGLNLRQSIKFRRKQRLDREKRTTYQNTLLDKSGVKLFDDLMASRKSTGLALQRQLVAETTGSEPTSAYDYCVYHDGTDLFDQMVLDLESAKDHIHLEYFHFEDDWLGERIGKVLREKARAGVEVRVIYDAVGSMSASRSFWRKLEKAGVEVSPFFEVRFRHLANRVNYRNHRKIAVIDGDFGYTGGFNVSKEYIEGLDELKGHWRDTHIRMRGPVVNHLQLTFVFDWRFSQGIELIDDRYFPNDDPYADTIPIQITSSGPDTEFNNIKYAYFNILTRAEKYVYLVTPYFTPDRSVIAAMKTAALSGIDVRLMLPKRSDSLFVTLASNSYIKELIEANVKVYHYTKGMLHSKVVVADDVVTSIGTANMDARSHDLNFEINAILYDVQIATDEREILEREMESCCEKITAETWHDPPLHIQFARGFARAFAPLL
jgi:cardiolipin synthase